MAATGPRLQLAGFDVRVPELSRRPSTPSLRIFVDAVSETAVGANQLANVRWSAVFDDVELTAADIARWRRKRGRSIRSGGRWVAIDHADLNAAAAALAERETTQQLSGAEMLRLALGLEDSPLAGGISIDGGGWAADLLAAAADVAAEPARAPEGLRRRAAQLSGRSAGVARLPRRRRPRRLPRARHGPRQDADDARPPARRARATGPRW